MFIMEILTSVSLCLVGLATIAFLASGRLFGHDAREPPLAPQSIPFIGHLIGLAQSKLNYYVELSQRAGSPIFTLPLPGRKIYVVTKPELIKAVQKQPHIFAFPPIQAKFASKMCGVGVDTQAVLAKSINGDERELGLFEESQAAMRTALAPGELLDDLNRTMIQEIATSLDLLEPAPGIARKVSIHSWLRHTITMAISRSVYGPMNPYEDQVVADAFWEFSNGIMSILIGFLPFITCRKPVAAREKVAKAFEAYYKAGGLENASALARMRYQAQINHNMPLEDIALFEVGGSTAVLLNTAPAAFWTLVLLHSHPGLIDDIRLEIDACTKTTMEDGSTVKSIDITTLKDACPLLLSSYQEMLRCCSVGVSVREVMEESYLDRWLLKKGVMLQLPSRVIHRDSSLWGDDVDDFNPRRFLPEERQSRPSDVCFRSFGGGKTLCPGRHFAINEVLAVVAVFIARLDMKPVDGEWKLPSSGNTSTAAVIEEPDDDIEVEITTRKGFEGVKWAVGLRKSEKIFAMVTEDSAWTEDSTGRVSN